MAGMCKHFPPKICSEIWLIFTINQSWKVTTGELPASYAWDMFNFFGENLDDFRN